MTLERIEHKVFASEAPLEEMGQFGSALATTKLNTKDVAEIQALPAYTQGWGSAIISENNYPAMEEMNGVLNVMSYHTGYLYQEGIPTYSATQEYSVTSWVKDLAGEKVYKSLQGGNKGHDLTDPAWWMELKLGGGGLEIGDIGFTQMAIDESKGKRRKLNGQLIIQDQYVQFTNIIKNSVALNPDLACTEEEWQTAVTMSTNGVCEKFVIDDNAGTIRLPKYPNCFIAGLTGVAPVVGNGMALGFTDGTYTKYTYGARSGNNAWTAQPSFFNSTQGNVGETTNNSCEFFSDYKYIGISTDPTKSGLEAQIKQEKIVGSYFIQVATGSETEDNIINEIELNNPFSLLDYKFSEYELNNLSWLRSNGQYNSKATHPAVYDLLLKIYNGTETKAGVSVKLWTDESATDYDFRINTAEETFMLPTKVKLASGKEVVGNGITLGLTDGNVNAGVTIANSDEMRLEKNAYGTNVGNVTTQSPPASSNFTCFGVTTDPTKSGLELSDSDLYLYFYVGETVQNANLINAGRIEEKLVDKLDRGNKQEIISWAMPDYSAGINITSLPYTAPKDGLISILGQIANGVMVLKLNNNPMTVVDSTATGVFVRDIRVKKGDVLDKLTVTGTVPYNNSSRNEYSMFYPLKGAN